MTDAKTKVIFGGLNVDDAEVLAEQAFLGEIDLEEAKESLNKPVVVGYIRTWLNNYTSGTSRSSGTNQSRSQGSGEGMSENEGEATRPMDQFFLEDQIIAQTVGASRISSNFQSEGEGNFEMTAESESHGRSESLMPVLQVMPSQVFSYEEQIYKAMALMVNQPARHALVKLPKKHTQFIKTPFIKTGFAPKTMINGFKEKAFILSDFARPKGEIEIEIQQRQDLLAEKAKELEVGKPKTEEPSKFRG
ncbi:MAG: hypothetical protein HQL10_13830 [Nitrospirae bacterium]|nr:hypothetical protein [Nitrospirota bacterium]